eukprot:gene10883-7545_t
MHPSRFINTATVPLPVINERKDFWVFRLKRRGSIALDTSRGTRRKPNQTKPNKKQQQQQQKNKQYNQTIKLSNYRSNEKNSEPYDMTSLSLPTPNTFPFQWEDLDIRQVALPVVCAATAGTEPGDGGTAPRTPQHQKEKNNEKQQQQKYLLLVHTIYSSAFLASSSIRILFISFIPLAMLIRYRARSGALRRWCTARLVAVTARPASTLPSAPSTRCWCTAAHPCGCCATGPASPSSLSLLTQYPVSAAHLVRRTAPLRSPCFTCSADSPIAPDSSTDPADTAVKVESGELDRPHNDAEQQKSKESREVKGRPGISRLLAAAGFSRCREDNKLWAGEINEINPNYFAEMAARQQPQYLWIGCSDSRVPANELVGLYPGDVFVHRNVGNVVCNSDLNVLAVLQYAVDCLKVEHVIVSGHYNCGAAMAALSDTRVGLADHWILHISTVKKRHWKKMQELIPSANHLNALCELNILAQVENVVETHLIQRIWRRQNDEERAALLDGKKTPIRKEDEVNIHGWVYDIETGHIKPPAIREARRALFLRYGQGR